MHGKSMSNMSSLRSGSYPRTREVDPRPVARRAQRGGSPPCRWRLAGRHWHQRWQARGSRQNLTHWRHKPRMHLVRASARLQAPSPRVLRVRLDPPFRPTPPNRWGKRSFRALLGPRRRPRSRDAKSVGPAALGSVCALVRGQHGGARSAQTWSNTLRPQLQAAIARAQPRVGRSGRGSAQAQPRG